MLLDLDLTGRRVVVVGDGSAAEEHARRLAAAGADVTCLPSADEPRLPDLVAAAALVVAAAGDARHDERVAAAAQSHGTWCTVVAAPERGSAREPGRAWRGRRPGRVVLVGAGPGDPGLLTVAGRRALDEADVVVADRLGTEEVLAELRKDVEVLDVGKRPGHHPVPQAEIDALLVAHARRGRTVVRLKGGDSFVLGRGGEEVRACATAGVPVEVVPGVSSALSGPALAGIPLTHRGTTTSFLVASGHDGADAAVLAALAAGTTVVLLMAVAALPRVSAAALAAGVDADLPAALVQDASLPTQRLVRATLSTMADAASTAGVRAPAVVVLGAVAAPGLLAAACGVPTT